MRDAYARQELLTGSRAQVSSNQFRLLRPGLLGAQRVSGSAARLEIVQNSSIAGELRKKRIPFGRDLSIALFIVYPNCPLGAAHGSDQRLAIWCHGDAALFCRSRGDTLRRPVGIPHAPDVEARSTRICRQIDPLP